MELETSIATLKDRLRERNNQKRDLLNELMEARKLVWEYKQEASRAKQSVKHLIVENVGDKTCDEVGIDGEVVDTEQAIRDHLSGANDQSPPRIRTLSPRGDGGGASSKERKLVKSQSSQDLKKVTVGTCASVCHTACWGGGHGERGFFGFGCRGK